MSASRPAGVRSPWIASDAAERIVRILSTGAIVITLLGLFARIMAYPVRHDEQMYLPVGAMLGQGDLYTDFGFNNLPNLPLALSVVFGASGTDHYLLTGRLLIFAGWLIALAAMAYVTWRATRSRPAAILAAILIATNPVLAGPTGMLVTNNFLPLTCALAAFALMISAIDGASVHISRMTGAGLGVALAAGFKANYAYLIPLFAAAVLFAPSVLTLRERLFRSLIPFGIGGIIGSAPTLYYLLCDPQAFLAHVIHYHRGPHIAYWLANANVDGEKIMTLGGKLRLAAKIWLGGGMVVVIVMAAIFGAMIMRDRHGEDATGRNWPILMLLAIIAGGAAMSFLPTPAFPQYYALPLPFIILLAAFLYGRLAADRQKRIMPWALAATALVAAAGMPRLLVRLPQLVTPARWTGVEVHAAGVELARLTQGASNPGPVATLAPLYPLEGGLTLYPELVTGPLVYRVGDIIPAEDRRYYARITSPRTIGAMLGTHPPAAILVGQEGTLDQPLIDYARDKAYRLATGELVNDRYGKAALYVRR